MDRIAPPLERAEQLVLAFAGKRILVAGDLMLDEYLGGAVRRISPEAPVPVVEISHRAHVPGGAGNVAANIAALGGVPILLGIVGDDENGRALCRLLEGLQVDTSAVLVDSARPTTCKTRIVSGQQQIVRLDWEARIATNELFATRMTDAAVRLLPTIDSCVISDYAKGLLTPSLCSALIQEASAAAKLSVVDPKDADFRKYAGCTVITPNLREAEAAGNAVIGNGDDLPHLAEQLQVVLGAATSLLITRGAEGMSLFQHGRERCDVPALAHEVFDVTGAGDTVAATLALALAAESTLEEAMLMSNLAASVVVQKTGTATVTPDELLRAAHSDAGEPLSSRGSARSYLSLPNRLQVK